MQLRFMALAPRIMPGARPRRQVSCSNKPFSLMALSRPVFAILMELARHSE
jgi:hypothetical protein